MSNITRYHCRATLDLDNRKHTPTYPYPRYSKLSTEFWVYRVLWVRSLYFWGKLLHNNIRNEDLYFLRKDFLLREYRVGLNQNVLSILPLKFRTSQTFHFNLSSRFLLQNYFPIYTTESYRFCWIHSIIKHLIDLKKQKQ